MTRRDWRERLARLGLEIAGEPRALAGGDIAAVSRVETRQGPVVVKRDDPRTLAAEADGLRVLRDAGSALIVPEVIALDDDLLVMEALDSGGRHDGARLGAGLRQLHGVTGEAHGWPRDNRCGPRRSAIRRAPTAGSSSASIACWRWVGPVPSEVCSTPRRSLPSTGSPGISRLGCPMPRRAWYTATYGRATCSTRRRGRRSSTLPCTTTIPRLTWRC